MEILWIFFESIINVYKNSPMSIVATVGLIVVCILLKIYYPKMRGFWGEFWLKMELDKLSKEEYYILNDIMLETEFGTTQIDHLVLSKYGVFVIEMKNYYGFIYGDEFKEKWSQSFSKKKNYFYNPIRQNYAHIKALESILKLHPSCFISIICFSNQATLKVDSKTPVIQLDDICKTISEYKEVKLEGELSGIVDKLQSRNIRDKKTRVEHIKNIKENIGSREELEKNMVCPKCGKSLIERNGKYGRFIGCSDYPKCKYTSHIKK